MPIIAVQPHPDQILHISSPMTGYRFEWHPKKQIVYLVRIGSKMDIGEPIAYNIENHGAAWNAVLIYNRGYREGKMQSLGGQNVLS